MKYGYSKRFKLQFTDVVEKIKDALAKEGFGILTEIDVKKTMKAKLDADYDDYLILGACNPPFAHKTLQAEKEIGLLLPCNVIVYQDGKEVVVSAILPTVAMSMVENTDLGELALTVEAKLKKAVDSIE